MVFFILPTTMLVKKELLSKNKSLPLTVLGHFSPKVLIPLFALSTLYFDKV